MWIVALAANAIRINDKWACLQSLTKGFYALPPPTSTLAERAFNEALLRQPGILRYWPAAR
jgi:hypothetical protein